MTPFEWASLFLAGAAITLQAVSIWWKRDHGNDKQKHDP